MKLLDALRREHDTIEAVAGALVTFASSPAPDAADAERFVRFFRLYAGRFHHAREEHVLFRALVQETDVPEDSGPIRTLFGDHRDLGALLEELAAALADVPGAAREPAERYVSTLLHHIDAENSVLFPECEARFRRASVIDLDARAPDDEERAARDDALELVARYAASAPPGLFRGEGCVCCPAYGLTCDGVEREWSSDEEREDTLDRMGHG